MPGVASASVAIIAIGCGNPAAQTDEDLNANSGDWPADRAPPEPSEAAPDPPAEPCGTEQATRTWSFDESDEGWAAHVDGGHAYLQWIDAGMVQLDVIPGEASSWTAQAELGVDLGDMTGEGIASWVFVETDLVSNVFLRSGSGSTFDYWANGDWTELPAGSWYCVEFTVDAADYAGHEFDATDVTRIGVHFEGSGSARAFVDMLRY